MVSKAERNRISVNIWTARIIPVILAGVVGYATHVFVALLCVNYLLIKHNNAAAAIPILVVYFILFLLMASSFLRLVHITIWDPPYLTLGKAANRGKERNTFKEKGDGISGGEYDPGGSSGENSADTTRDDPDSPGLELFYTKDVFVCGMDGRPKWCSQCGFWKPDRTHHSRDAGRCIRRMDHFCPWVGGPIGENNFKFFVQFTGYTSLYCLHILVVAAVYIHKQVQAEDERVTPQFAAILGLAGFFGLFTAGMIGTSFGLLINNRTQVEHLALSSYKVHTLAILKPSPKKLLHVSPYMATHLAYSEITYPIENTKSFKRVPEPAAKYYAADGREVAIPPQYQGQFAERSSFEPLSCQISVGLKRPAKPEPSEESSTELMLESQEMSHDSHPEAATTELPAGILERIQEAGAQFIPSGFPLEETGIKTENKQEGIEESRQSHSSRDRLANRTFAILRTKEGTNPWDLGSRLANFQSIMGTNIFDYLLPIRRSPCCNHENSGSHFEVGPYVDLLKASVYFIEAKDIRDKHGGAKYSIKEFQKEIEETSKKRRTRKKRHGGRKARTEFSQPVGNENQLPMGNLSEGAV